MLSAPGSKNDVVITAALPHHPQGLTSPERGRMFPCLRTPPLATASGTEAETENRCSWTNTGACEIQSPTALSAMKYTIAPPPKAVYCVCIYYCIHAVVELFQKFVFWKFPKNKKSSEIFVCEVFTKQRKNALIFTTHSWTSRARSRGRGPAAHAVASARWHHLALFMPGPVRKCQGPSNSKLHCPHA